MISERQAKLGNALVQAKILTPEQLQQSIDAASKENAPSLIVGLLDQGFLTFKVFEKFVQSTLGVKSAIIANHDLSKDLVAKVGLNSITGNLIFPISLREDKGRRLLALGMVDPLDSATIEDLERSLNCKVVPILVSLPDFKEALKKNMPRFQGIKQIDLASVSPGKEDSFIFTHGNEYDLGAPLKTVAPVPRPPPAITIRELAAPSSHGINLPLAPAIKESFGNQGSKFREEILAKLELDPTDSLSLSKESYSQNELKLVLSQVNKAKLHALFKKASSDVKVEALLNLMIEKELVTKDEVLISTAISFIFKEES